MIDVHLHILPNIDDGPQSMQESLELAHALVQEGVRFAVATPHYNDEYKQCPAAEIRERVAVVQGELNRYGIPLRLFAGHEVLIKPGLMDDIRAGRVATLNGSNYLLLELWNSNWIPETEQVIFELCSNGIVPIIAHPERYHAIQKDPSRLAALEQQGVLAQVTTSSLLGIYGNTVRRTAETLLKKDLIHIIATDAHGLRKRRPYITDGLQSMQRLIGQERVQLMTETWPLAILKNEVCHVSSSVGRRR
ncbi:MAG: tyrosine protein phosphatase [Ktedonobacteraceae bacterium]